MNYHELLWLISLELLSLYRIVSMKVMGMQTPGCWLPGTHPLAFQAPVGACWVRWCIIWHQTRSPTWFDDKARLFHFPGLSPSVPWDACNCFLRNPASLSPPILSYFSILILATSWRCIEVFWNVSLVKGLGHPYLPNFCKESYKTKTCYHIYTILFISIQFFSYLFIYFKLLYIILYYYHIFFILS